MTQTDSVPEPSSPRLDRAVLDQLADVHGIDQLRPSPDGPGVKISDETVAKLPRALNVNIFRRAQIKASR
jgi:hypothetical protein